MNGALARFSFPLPDEVMRSIFLAFLEPDELGCSNPSSISSPLRLTWVCRYWRNLCLASPELWCGVVLVNTAQLGREDDVLNLLDLWIARSNPRPLSVKLNCTNQHPRETPLLILPTNQENAPYFRVMAGLISRLLACQARWRALNMNVLDLSVIDPLFRAMSQLPSSSYLEHITVSTQYLGIFGEIRTYSFEHAPRLRTINILSPLIVPRGPTILENLTEVDLSYCSTMRGCLSWLDRAPNLESLKVRFFTPEVQNLTGEHVRHLPRLKTLEITAYSTDSDPGPFIDLLDLPALHDLYVDMNDLICAEDWRYVLALLVRSQPNLGSIVLLGTPMSDEDVRECLRLVPGITYLGLGSVSEETLLAMTSHEIPGPDLQIQAPLCPAIEVLDIAYDDEYPLEPLARMVYSRFRDTTANQDSLLPLVDNESIAMKAFRTLEVLGIPYDHDSLMLQHPLIKACVERNPEMLSRLLDNEDGM